MAEERNQKPTLKRIQQARQKGQVTRSKELNITLLFSFGGMTLFFTAKNILLAITNMMEHAFTVSRETIINAEHGNYSFIWHDIFQLIFTLLPFFLVTCIVILLSPYLLGGYVFSTYRINPNLNHMNPIQGLKRIFSFNSIIESIKLLIKFLLIVLIFFFFLNFYSKKIFYLHDNDLPTALFSSKILFIQSFVFIFLALLLTTAIDIAYQIWHQLIKLKMSLQEIKQEVKESDVNPDVKKHRRKIAQRILKHKKIAPITKADVIIIDSNHLAIALHYQKTKSAPTLIAKGTGHMANHLIKVAEQHQIEILSLPDLAQSIYHDTELYGEIPTNLYSAIAKVFAYIYQLKCYQSGIGPKPSPLTDLPTSKKFTTPQQDNLE